MRLTQCQTGEEGNRRFLIGGGSVTQGKQGQGLNSPATQSIDPWGAPFRREMRKRGQPYEDGPIMVRRSTYSRLRVTFVYSGRSADIFHRADFSPRYSEPPRTAYLPMPAIVPPRLAPKSHASGVLKLFVLVILSLAAVTVVRQLTRCQLIAWSESWT